MPGQVRILCLDGGGMFGLIPGRILAEVERRTGKRIKDMFHMVAGTSTGGIIGGALVQENKLVTAEDMVDLYLDEGPKIFEKTLLSQIRSVNGWVKAKYSSENLRHAMATRMGDVKLSDIRDTDLLITAVDVKDMQPYAFHSWKARGDLVDEDDGETKESQDYYLRDIAVATASAPVLFPPAEIENMEGEKGYFVDGGMFATNPSMLALAEAQRLYPRADSYMIISLGTGEALEGVDVNKAKNWGALGWSDKHVGMFMGLRNSVTDYQVRKFLHPKHSDNEYFRISPDMSDYEGTDMEPNIQLDDASPENMANILAIADDIIRKENAQIERLCALLTKEMDPKAGFQKSLVSEPLKPHKVSKLCADDAKDDGAKGQKKFKNRRPRSRPMMRPS